MVGGGIGLLIVGVIVVAVCTGAGDIKEMLGIVRNQGAGGGLGGAGMGSAMSLDSMSMMSGGGF